MKVAALLLVCAISLAQGNDIELNENGCPIDHNIEKLYPHENCNKFYQCTHGNLIEKKCASNLFFDVEKQECDWSDTVDCGDRLVPDEKEDEDCDETENEGGDDSEDSDDNNGSCNCNPGEAPSICEQDGSDGVLIAHENCNQFYQCFNGKPVTISCPGKLLYNPHKKQCDWPENVDCGDRVIPEVDENDNDNDNGGGDAGGDGGDQGGDDGEDENDGTCNCNPGEAPEICGQDGSDGVLVAHENCNQFYKCYNGKPVTLSCPRNLLFNPYRRICDWPENVDCGDRVIPEVDDNDNDNGGGDAGGDEGGDDGEDGNDGTCNCNPGEAPEICGQDGSDGVLVAHENCNQFYKCYNGKPVTLSCPRNLLFNPYRRICDWPENVDCGDRLIPEVDENDNGGGDAGGDGGDQGGDDGEDENDGTCNCNPDEAPEICGQDGSDGVLVAHENCNQFYKCHNGKPVTLSCPGNLLFNPYKRICDWPENVDCGDRVIPEVDDNDNDNGGGDAGGDEGGDDGEDGNDGTCNCNPGEAPEICGQDGSDGVLVAHENCNQFYKCYNGKPVTLSCPRNLLFNPYRRICDWPENVDCGDRVIPEVDENDNGGGDAGGDGGDQGGDDGGDENDGTCNCNPGEAPEICGQDGSDGVLVAHENCNQFYKCHNGKPVTLSCPRNLLFNPYRRICDWPENVDCGDRVIPEVDENDNGGGDAGGDGGDQGGDDGEDENDGTCNCNPGEAPEICGQDGSDGVLVAHENCNQFYKCYNGKPVTLSCPRNLLFNPYRRICDWPENVDCGDRVIPEVDENDNGGGDAGGDGGDQGGDDGGDENDGTCNCNPGEAPEICGQDGSDGVLVAHENCNQFYKCHNGKPVTLSCPRNLLFNPYRRICDWPENVDCGDRVIPEVDENDNGGGDAGGDGGDQGGDDGEDENDGTCNCNPGEAPEICGQDGSDGVLVAHENCNQFYKCYNGKPVTLSCPRNLLFNPYRRICDWPENVDCGDRVIPEVDENDNGGGDAGGDGGDQGGDDGGDENDGTCNCNPGEAPEICGQDGSDGVLVAHENCNQFYKCHNGKPVTLSCPRNLLFNPYRRICDWPENVDCGDRVIPEVDENDNGGGDAGGDGGDQGGDDGEDENDGTCNCNPGEAPEICGQDGSDGVLVAHENCNQFYKCYNGKPVTLSCPRNLLFNPYRRICDWPDNVDCGDRVIPECNDNDNDNDNGGGDAGGDGGDEGGDDGEDNNDGTCNCNPGEAPAICGQDGSDGVLVAHENCTQFYQCSNGKPVTLNCPGKLLFNPYRRICDWPENVDCGDRLIPECNENNNDNDNDGGDAGGDGEDDNDGPCNCNPGEAPAICGQDGSDGVLIAHENCKQFYMCVNYKPIAMDCPVNLLYNPYKNLCDWPDNVNCGDRIESVALNKHLNGGRLRATRI